MPRASLEGQRPALGAGCGAHKSSASFQLMLLQPAVHGAPAQSQGFGGLADIPLVAGKCALNQILLHFVEAHLLELGGSAGGLRAQAAGAAAKLEEMSLDEVEKYLIQRTLSRHEGNVSQAAKALGLSRSAMYRRLQKHRLG